MREILLKPYYLIIQTLSPVHIGSGSKLGKIDFIIQDKQAAIIDENKLYSWISRQPDAERLALALADYLSDSKKGIKKYLGDHFLPRGDLSEILAYQIPITGDPSNILGFIKDISYRSFIPGTSVKGVLRSALLRGVMIKDTKFVEMAQGLIDFHKPKTNSDKIQAKLFAHNVDHVDPRKIPNFDINRLLMVRDSEPLKSGSLEVCLVKVLSINRKNGLDWKKIIFKGTTRDMEIYAECLRPQLIIRHPIVWQTHLLADKAQNLRFSNLEHLMVFLPEYCRRVSFNLLSQEHDFYQRHGNTELAGWFERQLNRLSKSSEEVFILPMGWGSGYDSKTITDLLDEATFNRVVDSFRYTRGLGKPGRRYEEKWLGPEDSPKSRKVVVRDGKLEPIGWVAMRIMPISESEDWLKTRRSVLVAKKPEVILDNEDSSSGKVGKLSSTDSTSYHAPSDSSTLLRSTSISEHDNQQLFNTFTEVPTVGDRFLGNVFNIEKDEIWLEIPGLDADNQAYAVILRSEEPTIGKVKNGQRLSCEVVEVMEEAKGYWRVKCKVS